MVPLLERLLRAWRTELAELLLLRSCLLFGVLSGSLAPEKLDLPDRSDKLTTPPGAIPMEPQGCPLPMGGCAMDASPMDPMAEGCPMPMGGCPTGGCPS